MGEHDVAGEPQDRQLRAFTKALLDDLRALEAILDRDDVFETGRRRIGAEQEMFLVDGAMYPAPRAVEVLDNLEDARLTTELASFNLEANSSPCLFEGSCLSDLQREIEELVGLTRTAAREAGADVVLTGILPTLRRSDLGLENMTPAPRYAALNTAMTRLRGGDFHVAIKGLDDLDVRHGNVMLEACNTSFQLHFQVAPAEFAKLYNVAQAVTGPVLAAAVNSPLLLGRRLWQETRVALFERSVDARSTAHAARGLRPRVSFGDHWVEESVVEIFREDVARFRALLAVDVDDDPLGDLAAGRVPELKALRLHEGTIYRWNRPCYGVENGKAHLRIENRSLPAGPTITDEIANAALYFGLMSAVLEECGDVARRMSFDDAKTNFLAAARHGLDAQLRWAGQRPRAAADLLLDTLLPMARRGLEAARIDATDADLYLDVVRRRVESGLTGSAWMLRSLAAMGNRANSDIRQRTLTACMLRQQSRGVPGHEWPTCELDDAEDWKEGYRTVGRFMTTDLFTVRPKDLVDLAASLMDWEHVRHVPVEDDQGRLVGILSHRALLRIVARGAESGDAEPVAVEAIMKPDPVTVSPDTTTLEAMRLMREHAVGCLPVVENERLVGIVTERDLVGVAAKLLESYLRDE